MVVRPAALRTPAHAVRGGWPANGQSPVLWDLSSACRSGLLCSTTVTAVRSRRACACTHVRVCCCPQSLRAFVEEAHEAEVAAKLQRVNGSEQAWLQVREVGQGTLGLAARTQEGARVPRCCVARRGQRRQPHLSTCAAVHGTARPCCCGLPLWRGAQTLAMRAEAALRAAISKAAQGTGAPAGGSGADGAATPGGASEGGAAAAAGGAGEGGGGAPAAVGGKPAGGGGSRFPSLQSMIEPILGNLQLVVTNVHVRYEDDGAWAGHALALGVVLSRLAAHTVDEQGRPAWVPGSLMQLLRKVRAGGRGWREGWRGRQAACSRSSHGCVGQPSCTPCAGACGLAEVSSSKRTSDT